MVTVVQLVRASDCGSECRGFESHRSPKEIPCNIPLRGIFLFGADCILKVSIELSRLRFLQLLGDLRTFKIEEQWSPRQISGVLKKEGTSVSHQSIYNIIHADATGTLAQYTRHKLKYRRRPKHKHFLIAARISIH